MYVKEKILVSEGDLFVFSSFPGNNASCRVKYQVNVNQVYQSVSRMELRLELTALR